MLKRRKVLGLLAMAALPVTAGGITPASVWVRTINGDGEHWLCEGGAEKIRAAMDELNRVAQEPVRFHEGNQGTAKVDGKAVRIELRYAA